MIQKRDGKDIWRGLYQFPLIETEHLVSPEELSNLAPWMQIFGNSDPEISAISPVFTHQLTHQQLFARFYKISISSKLPVAESKFIMVNVNDLSSFAMPRLLVKYLTSSAYTQSNRGNFPGELFTNSTFAK